MKVALLSFHNAYNYGAALQAYGLQCAIQNLGIDCEYLNYQNPFRKHAYDMKYQFSQAVKNKKIVNAVRYLAGMPFMTVRGRRFVGFYSKYLKVTDQVYENSEAIAQLNECYNKFIVGSDQVWNYSNNGGDTAYLLDFVKDDRKKISYSSSFGFSTLTPDLEDIYREYLARFNRLSTRESIGTEIIEQITGRKAHLVLDPVFLAGKAEWDKIKAPTKEKKKKYIFFYTNRKSQIADFLNTGYDSGEEFHVLSTHITPKELLNRRIKTRIAMSPEEFLEEISSSELVVTASFHCLALAIIYHKQFVVILTGDHGKDERITNLLRIAGLEARILKSTTNKADVLKKIDFSEVDARIEKQLFYSREYLRRAIFDEPDIEVDSSFKNQYFCKDSRCFGCGACENVCPVKAITMKPNEEGFLVPELETEKCIHCFKCHEVCQVYAQKESVIDQNYFAVKNNDDIRRTSSSGGMFMALASFILEHRGIVCAAGMDGQFKVYHMFASNKDELVPMRGTYYVQSTIGDTFKHIRDLLKEDRLILFVGTACQVKGLKEYLGCVPEKLVLCDIICHGAPSPMVFEKFIQMLKEHGTLKEFKFRDKSLGWKGYHVSGVINGKKITNKLWLQSFNNLFSHNMINRVNCGSCPYTNYNRPGDITIGDFWGIENSHRDFMDSLGVSLVLTNNEKGQKLLERLQLDSMIKVQKEETIQNSLVKPANISSKRLQVFQTIIRKGYAAAQKDYAEVSGAGWLKNKVRTVYILARHRGT